MAKPQNHGWRLASRPHGKPVLENFEFGELPLPSLEEGDLLLRTIYLSLDPYMRGRMSDAKSYAEPVKLGDVMVGGTVSRVVESRHADFQPGDWVLSSGGWQAYSVSPASAVRKLGNDLANPSWALGVLGMPGFTAYMGLLDIGEPQPGETWWWPQRPGR